MSAARSIIMALVLEGKRCLVLGNSAEATARARALAECGALVTVVGDCPGPELEALAASGAISLERRGFSFADLADTWLVVLADRDPALLEEVGPACLARRILFCAVDQPEHNTARHVAMVRSGPITLAVSTDGRAPALGKRLREELARVMRESSFESFAERVAELREATPGTERKIELERALGGLRLGSWEVPDE